MLRQLAQSPSALFLALAAASAGLFLLVANLAERPVETRFIVALTLMVPLSLYILAYLRRFVR